jgi:hypothetical protein
MEHDDLFTSNDATRDAASARALGSQRLHSHDANPEKAHIKRRKCPAVQSDERQLVRQFMSKYELILKLAIKTRNAGVAWAAVNAQAKLTGLLDAVSKLSAEKRDSD